MSGVRARGSWPAAISFTLFSIQDRLDISYTQDSLARSQEASPSLLPATIHPPPQDETTNFAWKRERGAFPLCIVDTIPAAFSDSKLHVYSLFFCFFSDPFRGRARDLDWTYRARSGPEYGIFCVTWGEDLRNLPACRLPTYLVLYQTPDKQVNLQQFEPQTHDKPINEFPYLASKSPSRNQSGLGTTFAPMRLSAHRLDGVRTRRGVDGVLTGR